MPRTLTRRDLLGGSAASLALALAGCTDGGNRATPTETDTLPENATPPDGEAHQYSAPGCSCCTEYATYLRGRLDESVTATKTGEMDAIKAQYGIPDALRSCHTVLVGGFVVEGHVPAAVIETVRSEAPDIGGIALPGMPAGSPGMSGSKDGPFAIYGFADGESVGVYAEV
jgi:hypothetical protein